MVLPKEVVERTFSERGGKMQQRRQGHYHATSNTYNADKHQKPHDPLFNWFWKARYALSTNLYKNAWSLSLAVLVACGMAQSKEGMALSPLESLTTVLRKLSAEEFVSERVLRHSAIQRQIQSLLQSPAELQSLSSALHEEWLPLISSLPLQKGRQQSFQIQLWPKFHVFRVRDAPRIWRNCQLAISDVDPILLHVQYGGIIESSVVEEKDKRRRSMSLDEGNAIR